MSVFFSDIRDFTSLSENLPPKELCDLINAILTPITQIIHHHKGTIDKYIGDAVMAFWGAPLENNHHAHDAISAGLEIIEHLQALQADFQQQGYPPIKLGIGINTGIMSVGNMGSQFRTAYTVMGDSVNLGSRLEGLTKYYGVDFIVSEHTQMAAPRFIYRELDKVQVKGKKKPVIIYEVIGLLENVSSDYLAYLQVLKQAFSYYYQQNWDNAQQMLQQLHQQNPHDKLHPLYLKRIETFKAYPPEKNWNGVFIHTQK